MRKFLIIFLLIAALTVTIYLLDSTIFSPSNQARNHIQPNYDEERRTIQQKENQVEINFSVCEEDRRRIDVGSGSTTIAIEGKSGDFCRIYYGGEVENPNWNGDLPYVCDVPTEKGIMKFQTNPFGVKFEQLSNYCKK